MSVNQSTPLMEGAWDASRERPLALPILGLLLTFLTTTLAGADLMLLFREKLAITINFDRYLMVLQSPSLWMDGLYFSLPLLAILLAHEFGHFYAAEYYGVAATWPYFVPAPPPFGVIGAFVLLKSPVLKRRALFDIAIAGPLAGFGVLLPVLLIGITMSQTRPGLARESDLVFGMPMLVQALAKFKFPGVPLEDIYLHPLARAAWVGLLATALNLLPIGHLDGGHLVYSFAGDFAKVIFWIAWAGLLVLAAFFSWQIWLVWAAVLLYSRLNHPRIFDTTPLGRWRIALAVAALLIFVVSFAPAPVRVPGF